MLFCVIFQAESGHSVQLEPRTIGRSVVSSISCTRTHATTATSIGLKAVAESHPVAVIGSEIFGQHRGLIGDRSEGRLDHGIVGHRGVLAAAEQYHWSMEVSLRHGTTDWSNRGDVAIGACGGRREATLRVSRRANVSRVNALVHNARRIGVARASLGASGLTVASPHGFAHKVRCSCSTGKQRSLFLAPTEAARLHRVGDPATNMIEDPGFASTPHCQVRRVSSSCMHCARE